MQLMKALFLVGGMGTRLRPLTNKIPKPMIPIMGKPLLERSILNLKSVGIKEVVLSTCYRAQYIQRYFENGEKLGMKIYHVKEDIPLGTGGAIKNAEEYFDDTFLIFNSDILSDIDIKEFIKYHREKGADVTIAVTQVDDPSMYGVIEYDENDYAISFKEKPQPHEVTSNFINAGAYIFEPKVLEEIPAGRVVSVEKEVFPQLIEKGYKIAVYKGCSYWIDIGTPERYLQAHMDIMSGKYRINGLNFSSKGIYKGPGCDIHSSVKICEPVYIGANVKIEENASIGANTIIGDNVRIGRGVKIMRSIIWNDVVVENGATLVDTIVASNCRIKQGCDYYSTVYVGEDSRPMAI